MPKKKQKNNVTARQGGFHMESAMFDIGLNITSSQFDHDRDEMIARARAAGVSNMLFTGTSLEESEKACAFARRYEGCWSTAGVHPHDASTWNDESAARLCALAGEAQVMAIGECGLDFNRNFSTPAEQEHAFTEQLRLAA